MRKILIALLLVASQATSIHAQIDLAELLRGKIGVSSASGVAKEAISPELYVIRQQYRLERNGEHFGKNNMPFYGETYSLAVKVPGGMMFLGDVVEPWKYDSDYNRVNASGKYKPELFWTYQRPIADSTYKAVELELGTEYVSPVNAEKSLYLHTEKKGDFGLNIDSSTGKKAGYMIWAYSKSDIQDSAMVVELRQSADSIDVRADSTLITMSPANPEKIIGGIYVTPKYGRAGQVQFVLNGIAVRKSATAWGLQFLATDGEVTKSEAAGSGDKDAGDRKAGSRKKKGKQTDSSEPTPSK